MRRNLLFFVCFCLLIPASQGQQTDANQLLNEFTNVGTQKCSEKPECEDLTNLSCSQSEINDKTGGGPSHPMNAAGDDSYLDQYANKKAEEFRPEIKTKVGHLIKTVSNDALEKLKSAFNFSSSECKADQRSGCGHLEDILAQEYLDQILMTSKGCREEHPSVQCDRDAVSNLFIQGESISDIQNRPAGELGRETKLLQKEIFESVRGRFENVKYLDKIQNKIFPDVRDEVLAFVNDYFKPLPTDSPDLSKRKKETAEKIKAVIGKVWFRGFDCTNAQRKKESDVYVEKRFSFSNSRVNNSFYNPEPVNGVRLCEGTVIQNPSEFKIVKTLAHEIAHSVDPCSAGGMNRVVKYSEKKAGESQSAYMNRLNQEFPFKGVLSCLRGANSVEATRVEPTTLPHIPAQPGFGVTADDIKQMQIEKDVAFCQGTDQLTEGFPDWLAAQVLPKYMKKHHPELTQDDYTKGYANAERGRCGQKSVDSHSTNEDRINQILLNQPQIRAQMGCKHAKPDRNDACAAEPYI